MKPNKIGPMSGPMNLISSVSSLCPQWLNSVQSVVMSVYYSHLLIPERAEFVPQPAQVRGFFDGLVRLNSAPLEPTFKIAASSGKVLIGKNPQTGETLSIPVRDSTSLQSIAEIQNRLEGLNDYDMSMSGQGPAKVPPFTLYATTPSGESSEFTGTYEYEVRCSLRPMVVSTCEEPPFGEPRPPEAHDGIFYHPVSGAKIEVPNAACARFWITFQFGKLLLPRLSNDLNVLEPSILSSAAEHFGINFAQGCSYG